MTRDSSLIDSFDSLILYTHRKNDTHQLNKTENLDINNNFIQRAINNVKTLKTWIYLIYFFCMMVMAY